MKKIFILFISVILLMSSQCKKDLSEKRNIPLYFDNNSSLRVTVLFNTNIDRKAVYPDTNIQLLTGPDKRAMIESSKSILLMEVGSTWSDYFKRSVPNDTISLFVYEWDSLATIPWDTIRSQYLILQRYDLSLKDLENRKFEIEYPYDPSRGKLKVWKP